MTKHNFLEAKRVMVSPLANAEKRTLIWLAHRMPAWVNSDHLTLLGFAALLAAGLSYWAARCNQKALWLVVLMLAVNWFGDSLDGTLARVRNRQRPRYGFYVDHIVDAFGMLFLMLGLSSSGYMSWQVSYGVLIAYLMISIEVYLATYTIGKFQITFAGFGPTELRIVLAVGTIALLRNPMVNVRGTDYLLFDVGGVIAILGMGMVVILSAVKNARTLYNEERLA
jgi:archaetidylinositol phosphate synthase